MVRAEVEIGDGLNTWPRTSSGMCMGLGQKRRFRSPLSTEAFKED